MDIKEKIPAVDVVDETREAEQTEDDFNENNKGFGMVLVSPFGKSLRETVPAYPEKRHSANIMRRKSGITTYAIQRICDIVFRFKCIFAQCMLDTITSEKIEKAEVKRK